MWPSNRRLQLTAFGARDRCYFEAILCSAPRRQLKRRPLDGGPSYSRAMALPTQPMAHFGTGRCREECHQQGQDQSHHHQHRPLQRGWLADLTPRHGSLFRAGKRDTIPAQHLPHDRLAGWRGKEPRVRIGHLIDSLWTEGAQVATPAGPWMGLVVQAIENIELAIRSLDRANQGI